MVCCSSLLEKRFLTKRWGNDTEAVLSLLFWIHAFIFIARLPAMVSKLLFEWQFLALSAFSSLCLPSTSAETSTFEPSTRSDQRPWGWGWGWGSPGNPEETCVCGPQKGSLHSRLTLGQARQLLAVKCWRNRHFLFYSLFCLFVCFSFKTVFSTISFWCVFNLNFKHHFSPYLTPHFIVFPSQ